MCIRYRRKTLLQRLRAELPIPVVETRGYITKATRERLLKLPKSHTNDALAIAMGRHGFGTVSYTHLVWLKYKNVQVHII